eukprot:1146063-Pelagomonas_calceolata.AAC.12
MLAVACTLPHSAVRNSPPGCARWALHSLCSLGGYLPAQARGTPATTKFWTGTADRPGKDSQAQNRTPPDSRTHARSVANTYPLLASQHSQQSVSSHQVVTQGSKNKRLVCHSDQAVIMYPETTLKRQLVPLKKKVMHICRREDKHAR